MARTPAKKDPARSVRLKQALTDYKANHPGESITYGTISDALGVAESTVAHWFGGVSLGSYREALCLLIEAEPDHIDPPKHAPMSPLEQRLAHIEELLDELLCQREAALGEVTTEQAHQGILNFMAWQRRAADDIGLRDRQRRQASGGTTDPPPKRPEDDS